MRLRSVRSFALAGATTILMTAAGGAIAPSAAKGAGLLNPTQLGTVPAPFTSGHAGLYAWGAATMPDGSVIVGDYWNHRVLHYDVNGNPIGSGAPNCNVPGCLFSMGSAAVYGTPYGLAVDPRTKAIYVGFECCAVEKFSLNSKGVYLSPKRIKHTGFSYPSRVAVGDDGTLYVADMVADKIFVFNSAGTWETTWGSKGSGLGQFNGPTGIALDQSSPQNLYIADPGNKRVDVINTATGQFGTAFGGTGVLGADLRGLAVDAAAGYLYVVDDSTGTIHQYTLPSETYVKDIGAPWTAAQGNMGRTCCAPTGEFANGGREATVDGSGDLWVGDMPDYRVQVFASSGAYLFSDAGSPVGPANGGFDGPHGVAVDPNTGNVVVSDTYNFRIQEFTSTGTFQWAEGMRDNVSTSMPYGLNYPMGMAVESDGSILTVDSYNQAIHKYDSNGNQVWTFTGKGTSALNHPEGIALGANGTIYVADYLKKRVVQLLDSGTSVSWVGTFGSGLNQPSGVAVDPATHNVFVSDFAGDDVIEFSSAGTRIATIGGGTLQNPADVVLDGTYIYVSDSKLNQVLVFNESDGTLVSTFGGTGSGAAQFNSPIGLALSGGNLYVADSGNDRISEWCVTGC
ncbi:MAG: NHL repeat-containing protein [Candidatus Dormiibacterota bacterium]